MAIHKVAVGELCHPNRMSWPERPDLSLSPHGAELRLFFAAPTEKEVTAVRSGKRHCSPGWREPRRHAVLPLRRRHPVG